MLYCTETGQVGNSLNSPKLLFGYQKDLSLDLPPALAVPRDADSATKLQDEIRETFKPYLRLPVSKIPIKGEIESRSTDWGYAVEKGRLVFDEGIFSPYSFYALTESTSKRRAITRPPRWCWCCMNVASRASRRMAAG